MTDQPTLAAGLREIQIQIQSWLDWQENEQKPVKANASNKTLQEWVAILAESQSLIARAEAEAKYVPMLVAALREIKQSQECHEEWYRTIAREALAQLPEEYRK